MSRARDYINSRRKATRPWSAIFRRTAAELLASGPGKVRIWDTLAGKESVAWDNHRLGAVSVGAFSDDGFFAAFGSGKDLNVWRVSDKKELGAPFRRRPAKSPRSRFRRTIAAHFQGTPTGRSRCGISSAPND